MFRTIAATSLLALACVMPVQQAAAQDPVAGGIFGGAVGGILGGVLGGRGGAVAGAIIGGTTGAAIAAQGERRANGYYWYNNGCYVQQPDGAWMLIAPQYCGGPAVYAPPPPAYGPPPRAVYGPPPAYGPPQAVAVEDDDDMEPAPAPVVSAEAAAACARKYRSYDPRSGTFLSFDGTRKPCP